ncbi:MAG: ParB/RepB/Spo0J family partition protein [Candidatus Riflebacteria bacterium]|nr:ParB/RepB/Spo0J family partition protein [Candidatus Riflebacteria bacterium]CAB1243455.1 DNA-binding protein Spo0J-like [Ruminococcaceae bacterium BL-4]
MRQKILELNIDAIHPNPSQPRKFFGEEELRSLAESIQRNGLIQPIVVRRTLKGYELVAGERRLRACKMAGLWVIPAVLSEYSENESAVMALIENLQRSNLNLFEEAEGIRRLMQKANLTQEECAQRLGKSQSSVANKLRLLNLSLDLRQQIISAGLTERHARALLRLPEKSRQKTLDSILSQKLNVQQTEQMVDKLLNPNKKQKSSAPRRLLIIKDVRIFGNTIDHAVKTLQSAGVQAEASCSKKEDCLEWVIRITQKKRPA